MMQEPRASSGRPRKFDTEKIKYNTKNLHKTIHSLIHF